MARPTNNTNIQPTTTPKLHPVTLTKLAATDLRFSTNEKRKLSTDELDAVEAAVSEVLDWAVLISDREHFATAEAKARKVISTARALDEAMKAFRELDGREVMTKNALSYAAGLTGRRDLTALARSVRGLSNTDVSELVGSSSKSSPTDKRNKLGIQLLRIFDAAKGEITKTKSKGGNNSSIAANWLVDVGEAISSDNPNYKDLVFTTKPSAEELVIFYAKNSKGN